MKTREKTKGRFNVIDLLIIVIVLGCIAGIVYRYNLVDRLIVDSTRDEVTVRFVTASVSKDIDEKLSDGDEFYIESSGEKFGTLTGHSSTDNSYVASDDNGRPVISYNKELRDIEGTISCRGVMRDEGFFIGGTQFVAPGSELVIESVNVRISVIITEISR